MINKVCSKCYVEKPLEGFSKKSTGKFGRNSICILCKRKQMNSWYQNNKEVKAEANRKWQRANLSYFRESAANRKCNKLKATPAWLSEEHLQEMRNTYSHAKECELLTGDLYHVDHIVPLQGKTVCGLHVPWNLQVLPAEVNISKNNSYNDWEEYADSETGL